MLHACAAKFDVMENFEKFLAFWVKPKSLKRKRRPMSSGNFSKKKELRSVVARLVSRVTCVDRRRAVPDLHEAPILTHAPPSRPPLLLSPLFE